MMARERFRIEGLAGVLDTLKRLPPEIVSKAGGPVKLALKRGAELLVSEAKINVRKIIDEPNKDGVGSDSTGLLLLSIRAKRSKPSRGQRGEAYIVGIKPAQRYPSNRGANLTAVQIGRQLEYGTEKRRAMPWLRPAFDAKKQAATDAFVAEITKRADAIIRKLDRQASRK